MDIFSGTAQSSYYNSPSVHLSVPMSAKTADKLVAEANERLKKALASKSQRMVEICAAQALLESGHDKLSQTNSSLELELK